MSSAVASPSSGAPGIQINKDICFVCQKAVYPMDKLTADDKTFHKTCLRCGHCSKVLSLGNYAALNGTFYCKPHFKQLFANNGGKYNFADDKNGNGSKANSTSDLTKTATSPLKSPRSIEMLNTSSREKLNKSSGSKEGLGSSPISSDPAGQLSEYQQKVNAIKNQSTASPSDPIATLESEISTLKVNITTKEKEIEKMQGELKSKVEQLASLKN